MAEGIEEEEEINDGGDCCGDNSVVFNIVLVYGLGK
jgi:hypothetical protein